VTNQSVPAGSGGEERAGEHLKAEMELRARQRR